jgi:16S rRNA (cytosine967-C5)-methyltransferase
VNRRRTVSSSRVRSASEGRVEKESVRSVAVRIVERTLQSRSPVDAFLLGAAEGFDERDQALLRELVLGTLRWMKRLDHVLVEGSGRRLEQIQSDLLSILRVAIYQLLFLDRVPAHAIVSEAVDEAHRRSRRAAASFVNAILRRISREPRLEAWPVRIESPVERLAVETSHPELVVRRWLDRFGEVRTRSLLDANNRQKPMHLLAFRGKGGRELLAESLIEEGIEVEPSRISPVGLVVRDGQPLRTASFRRGEFYVQDEAAQFVALLPRPRPGERVLDAAAAPGGKGLALLAAEPTIALASADLSLPRLATLAANHRRIGAASRIVAASATASPFRSRFDRVLVDYPCSGTGTFRKHPELKWRFGLGELARLADQAVEMLVGASLAVAEEGRLVAISCSLEAEENEEVGRRFLAERSDFRRAKPDEVTTAQVGVHLDEEGALRIFPEDDHDGFTVQVFERSKSRETLY